MTCSRWISVCVEMLDHPIVGMSIPPPKPHDPSRHAVQPSMAWLDLIVAASWKDREVRHKEKIITLRRGEFLAGRSYWAKRWNWGEQAVRSFFSRLAKCEMIAISNQSIGHTSNIVSICNYDVYQGVKAYLQPEEKPVPNQRSTSAQPEVNQTVQRNTNTEIEITRERETDSSETIQVDSSAIQGPGFKIDLKAVELSAALHGVPADRAKQIAEICARDWAAAGKIPDHPMGMVNAAIAGDKNRAAIQSVRVDRAASTPPPRVPSATPVHRVSPETVRYAKPSLDDSWLHEMRAKNERRAATC